MNDFKERIRYVEPKGKEYKRRISRPKKNNQRYNGKFIKRVIAILLATGTIVGVKGCTTGARGSDTINTINEVQEHNLKSSDLQMSQELYGKIMELKSELEEAERNNFENISNIQLINYLSELDDLYLEILKSKVSTITGLDTSEFTLIAPDSSGSDCTLIKDSDRINGIGISMNSKQIDDYMRDIGTLRILSEDANSEDIKRAKFEEYILCYVKKIRWFSNFKNGN